MEEYKNIEEFIYYRKRYPNPSESKQLYDLLWNKYINNLNGNDKIIAIENDKMQDYEGGKIGNQAEVVKKIAGSAERFRGLHKNKKMIISVYYGERWGIYSIYVEVDCLSRLKLYKFRSDIPNFFEGWEIKLVTTSLWRRIVNLFRT